METDNKCIELHFTCLWDDLHPCQRDDPNWTYKKPVVLSTRCKAFPSWRSDVGFFDGGHFQRTRTGFSHMASEIIEEYGLGEINSGFSRIFHGSFFILLLFFAMPKWFRAQMVFPDGPGLHHEVPGDRRNLGFLCHRGRLHRQTHRSQRLQEIDEQHRSGSTGYIMIHGYIWIPSSKLTRLDLKMASGRVSRGNMWKLLIQASIWQALHEFTGGWWKKKSSSTSSTSGGHVFRLVATLFCYIICFSVWGPLSYIPNYRILGCYKAWT